MTPVNDAADLREALVNRLIGSGHLHTPAVIDAFRTTERHQFLPGVDLKSAYKETALVRVSMSTRQEWICRMPRFSFSAKSRPERWT